MHNSASDCHWAEAFKWERTDDDHVWRRSDGKYHFEDECSQFDETPYETAIECRTALSNYIVNYL